MILEVATLARAADVDVSDLTTAKRTGRARWVSPTRLSIPFDKDPTPAEVAAIRRRLTTATPEEEALVASMESSLAEVEAMLSNPNSGQQSPPQILGRAVATLLRWRLHEQRRGTPPATTEEV